MPVTRFSVDPDYVLDVLKVRPCKLEAFGVDTDGKLYFEISALDVPEDAPRCVVIQEHNVVTRKFERLHDVPPPEVQPPSSTPLFDEPEEGDL